MLKRNNPDIDAEAVTRYLRRRAPDSRESGSATPTPPATCALDELIVEAPGACVRTAYRVLLGREPTPAEQSHQQQRIERGASRLVFVLRLRYSPEGRRVGVRISGIGRRLRIGLGTRLRRYRVVAWVLDWFAGAAAIARLPAEVARLQRDNRALENQCNRLAARLDRAEMDSGAGSGAPPGSRDDNGGSPAAMDEALYLAFEERFRGDPASMRERLAPCLELLRTAGAGSAERPVLDLGCGRGEWLQLLTEAGLVGRGVDCSAAMVAVAQDRGQRVEQADAVAALTALERDSLGAITAFHLVEHLPFDTLTALLDRGWMALAPGGLLLLETPNPETLPTAAHRFWLDPTHRRPLPPALLAFLVEQRGFTAVEVERCHWPDDAPATDGTAFQGAVAEHLYGPQDYRVWARRPV